MRVLLTKLVTLLIGIGLLVALGVWLLSRETETTPLRLESETPFSKGESKPVPMVFDADGDGLPDWEEVLWSTDPQKPDTDGDGTPDGAEIVAHRNPRKAGPNDSLETPLAVSPLSKGVPESARAGVVSSLIKEVAHSDESEVVTTPAVSEYGTPFPKGDESPLHIFGNALGTIIQNGAVDTDAELAFWNSAAGNTKMTDELLRGFANLAKKYDRLATDIATVVPPPKAEGAHSALVLAYQNYAKGIHALAETKVGEVLPGPVMTAYGENTIALGRAVVAISDLFYSEGVGFLPTEPGSVFSFPR